VRVDEALVYALIAAAQQDGAAARGPALDLRLVQRLAYRRKQQHRRLCAFAFATRCTDRRKAACERLGQHHHARPPPKGRSSDAAVRALGIVTRVPQLHLHLALA